MRNVYGTPLKTGLEFDCLADIGRIETVHFSPDYWAGSGLADAPTAGEHEAWIYNNGTGMIVRRIDWSYSCYVTVEGYNIGFALRPGRYRRQVPERSVLRVQPARLQNRGVHRSQRLRRVPVHPFRHPAGGDRRLPGVLGGEADMFHTCSIDASNDAVFSEGTARVLMMSCDIQQGTLRLDGGYLSVINSDFAATPANHIELGYDVRGASILGNRFTGGARIIDNTSYPVNIDHAPLAVGSAAGLRLQEAGNHLSAGADEPVRRDRTRPTTPRRTG